MKFGDVRGRSMNDVKQRRRSGLEKEMPQCRWCGFGMGPKSSLPRDDRNTGRWRFRAATAIQVKDSSGSGNITLRTTGVVAAIGHIGITGPAIAAGEFLSDT